MKFFIVTCLLFVLIGCSEDPNNMNFDDLYVNDYVSSSSVMYQYMDYYIKGDTLKKAMNSKEGISSISTLNKDDTSNVALFYLEMIDVKYIIASFTTENQTYINLKNKPQAMITFLKYQKDKKEQFDYVGAKILVDYLFLEEDISMFETTYERTLVDGEHLFRIVEIRPLG